VIESLEEIDKSIFLALNGMHSSFGDTIMWYISTTYVWIPLYAFMLYYAFKKKGMRFALIILGGAGLCVLLADLTSVHLFKNVFLRYRPSHNVELQGLVHNVMKPNGEVYYGGMYGFVSSHAANVSAIGFFILLSFKNLNKKWCLLVVWAMLVMYSRIYLGVHYPSDILVGSALGLLIGWAVWKLSQKLNVETNVSQ
jgi:undecaprenyl-diphosphatase